MRNPGRGGRARRVPGGTGATVGRGESSSAAGLGAPIRAATCEADSVTIPCTTRVSDGSSMGEGACCDAQGSRDGGHARTVGQAGPPAAPDGRAPGLPPDERPPDGSAASLAAAATAERRPQRRSATRRTTTRHAATRATATATVRAARRIGSDSSVMTPGRDQARRGLGHGSVGEPPRDASTGPCCPPLRQTSPHPSEPHHQTPRSSSAGSRAAGDGRAPDSMAASSS
jgi:hypothetical protein